MCLKFAMQISDHDQNEIPTLRICPTRHPGGTLPRRTPDACESSLSLAQVPSAGPTGGSPLRGGR